MGSREQRVESICTYLYPVKCHRQAQEKLKKAYSLSQNQKKISALAAKHSDDKAAFTKALEPLLAEVEARDVLSKARV